MNEGGSTFSLARDSLLARQPGSGLERIRRRGYQRYRLVLANVDLALLWRRRWFIITMAVGFVLMAAADPGGPKSFRADRSRHVADGDNAICHRSYSTADSAAADHYRRSGAAAH